MPRSVFSRRVTGSRCHGFTHDVTRQRWSSVEAVRDRADVVLERNAVSERRHVMRPTLPLHADPAVAASRPAACPDPAAVLIPNDLRHKPLKQRSLHTRRISRVPDGLAAEENLLTVPVNVGRRSPPSPTPARSHRRGAKRARHGRAARAERQGRAAVGRPRSPKCSIGTAIRRSSRCRCWRSRRPRSGGCRAQPGATIAARATHEVRQQKQQRHQRGPVRKPVRCRWHECLRSFRRRRVLARGSLPGRRSVISEWFQSGRTPNQQDATDSSPGRHPRTRPATSAAPAAASPAQFSTRPQAASSGE